MKLYEYMGKEFLDRYGISIPRGKVVTSTVQAVEVAMELGEVVIKSQILTGKRGKAGGIGFAATTHEAKKEAARILKMKYHGLAVNKLLIEEKLSIQQEIYMAITVDYAIGLPVVLASLNGGVDVEDVSDETMVRYPIDINIGLQPYMIREISRRMGASEELTAGFIKLLPKLYRLFMDIDAELLEINPLALTPQGLVAADAKITIDDAALYLHPELPRIIEKTNLELKAEELEMTYVELSGNIAIMANGAGINMATLDLVQYYGGAAANFLDFGGGKGPERLAQALELLLETNPKVILINIFGGITRCDFVAEAFVRVQESMDLHIPVSFRLNGTNEAEGRNILKKIGVSVFESMEEAVRYAVDLSKA